MGGDHGHHRAILCAERGDLVRSLIAAFKRLGGWRARKRRESDLRAELESHFQLHMDDNLRAGMSPAEARRQAALRFGSVDAATEAVRTPWTVAWLGSSRPDP